MFATLANLRFFVVAFVFFFFCNFHSWNALFGLWFPVESNIRQLLHKKSQMFLLPWLPSQFTNGQSVFQISV